MSCSLLVMLVAEHLELEAGLGVAFSADKWQHSSTALCVQYLCSEKLVSERCPLLILLQLCKAGDLLVLLHRQTLRPKQLC